MIDANRKVMRRLLKGIQLEAGQADTQLKETDETKERMTRIGSPITRGNTDSFYAEVDATHSLLDARDAARKKIRAATVEVDSNGDPV